jgi:membrane-associated protease RseP (regulator of RpoE activity)
MSLLSFFYSNENNILALIVFALIILFVIIKRKRFSIEGKVLFIYRTKFGIVLMKKLSKYKRILNVYGMLGIFAGVISMGLMLYLLVPYLQMMISRPATTPAGLELVLPVSGVPGIVGVPIFYWLIALIVVVVLHEASHGIVALSRKIKIKASGFGFFLAFLPLAFVEPDEKSFAKAKRSDRLKVLSAGSFTNLILGLIFLVIYIFVSNYMVAAHTVSFYPLALNILSVIPGGPAAHANLTANATITQINGKQFLSPQQAESYLSVTPGTVVNLTSSSGQVYRITTTYNESINDTSTHSYIGILGEYTYLKLSPFFISPISRSAYPNNTPGAQILYWFDGLFLWISLISIGLGLANFLPIFYITDGCKIVNELLGYVIKDRAKLMKVTNAVIVFFSILFLFLTPLGTILFSNI